VNRLPQERLALLLKQGLGWADIERAAKIERVETRGAEAG